MDYQCPRCTSTIHLNWLYDPGAPVIQQIRCPVCNQEWWIPAEFPPKRFSIGWVVKRVQPPAGTVTIEVGTPSEAKKTVFSDFVVIKPLQDLYANLKGVGFWLLAVLVLVFLIKSGVADKRR